MPGATRDVTRSATLDQLIGRLFETIRRGVDTTAFDALVQMDLTMTQMRTVALLGEADGPLAITDLADGLAVSLPTAGRAVDHLVCEELVERREDPEDRRTRPVELTDAGRALMEIRRTAITEHIRGFSDNLPTDIADALATAIRAALEATPDAPGTPCGHSPPVTATEGR